MHNWSDGNGFALLKKNDDTLPYYAIRCNDKNISSRIKRLQKSAKYSNSTILFQTGCIPSGVNLYQKIKKLHGVKHYHNHFNITISEDELMENLTQMCDID